MTADFRSRPIETVDAHVGVLAEVLRCGRFESLTYLSSTRVYRGGRGPARETDALLVRPDDPDDLYNTSKLMGEALVLTDERPTRVVRLSNVYGPGDQSRNFLTEVVRDALAQKHVVLRTSLESEKDYVSVDDVVEILPEIAVRGDGVYNVASGVNVSNARIAEHLKARTGCTVEVDADAPTTRFPEISITRCAAEFDFRPRQLDDEFDRLIVEGVTA
jgi:nucleoside-diphosphate-sugar epimerase